MTSKKNITPLTPGGYYHIFNRGIDREKLFKDQEDYDLFLSVYAHYVSDFVNTYAYCLIPNHFHFLIKIKESDIFNYGKKVSEEFRKMFICYSQKFNKKYSRLGNLFTRPFKRIEITEMDYLKHLIFYIHFNPQKHEIADKFQQYGNSSYKLYLTFKDSKLDRAEVLEWFNDDLQEFIEYHTYLHDEKTIQKLILEKSNL